MRLSRMKLAISVRSVAWPPHESAPTSAGEINGRLLTHTIKGKPLSRALINSCLNQFFWATLIFVFEADSFVHGDIAPLRRSVMMKRTRPIVKA